MSAESNGTVESIKSYNEHMPQELRPLKIWAVHIGKIPTIKWTNTEKLMTFDNAIKQLQDQSWLDERRSYIEKHHPHTIGKPAGLMVVIRNTNYWLTDYDPRKTYSEFKQVGDYVVPSGKKTGKQEGLDDDQLECFEVHRQDQWGYPSTSGKGGHLWFRRDKCRKIGDNIVHVKLDGKYVSQFEVKHEVVYLPPILVPFNDRKTIGSSCEILDRCIEAADTYDKVRLAKPSKPDPTPPDPDWFTKTKDRLINQYQWCYQQGIDFIPPDHDGYGGWIKRLKTLQFTPEKITEIAKSCSNFNADTDYQDIKDATPYDNPKHQAKIEFANLKALGAAGKKPTKPKKPTKQTKANNKEITPTGKIVISRFMPMIDYQKCLETLGYKIRDHAYLGLQWFDGKEWRQYQSGMQEHIYWKIQQNITLDKAGEYKPPVFSKATRLEAITELLYRNQYNPLREYVDWIESQIPKIKPTMEDARILTRLFKPTIDRDILSDLGIKDAKVEIRDYFADSVLLGVKGIIARLWKAGCNFPFFLLFNGPMGCGKSYFAELLLPLLARSGFADSFDMGQTSKEKDLLLRSAALVECSELVGHGKKAISDHKSLISSKRTRHRVAYQPFPEEIVRNAIMIGTSNDDRCLPNDPDGDRRHLVLPVARHDDWSQLDVETKLPEIMDKYRDRLFALAIQELRAGRGCSLRYFKESSRLIRERLIKRTEKQHIPIELEIDVLVDPPRPAGDFQEMPEHLSYDEKISGIPLNVPPHCNVRSILKMIIKNAKRNPSVPKNMDAKWLASHLIDKGWINLGRRLLPAPYNNAKVTYFKPPTLLDT